jgi:hypothetical protein
MSEKNILLTVFAKERLFLIRFLIGVCHSQKPITIAATINTQNKYKELHEY